MRMLVTGGAGFIGSNLVDALLSQGHDVTVLDDLSRGRREQLNPEARFVEADVVGDLTAVFAEARPEVVVHQAAQIDVRRSVSEPLVDTRINVMGTVNLLQNCADADVSRVVFASSGGAIYGDTEVVPTPESHPCRPVSNYGAAKLAGETYGEVYASLYGMDFVALRYANVYGPRQDPHGEAGVVAIFTERMLRGETPTINGDGTQSRDYVFVGDVVSANLAALSSPPGLYNIGTGVQCDVNELYRRLARVIGFPEPAGHGPAKGGEQQRSCLAIGLAAERLEWRPRVSLDQGLATTVAFFRDRHRAGAER
jgi:UDP-glucose 4-epimerase